MKFFVEDEKIRLYAQMLAQLRSNNSRFVPAKELAASLNTTKQRVYDGISYLRSCGYELLATPHEGYRLMERLGVPKGPDKILPVEIWAGLSCHTLGSRIFSYKSIGSTNEAAHNLARSGMPEGTLVIADSQTKGRGRLGRKWHSPPGKGLYFSLILRPPLVPAKTPGLSLIAGLAVVRAIYDLVGLKALMKWPNDIVVDGKKLAGILIELEAELDRVDYVIVGIGINVSHRKSDFPLSLVRKATSLRLASGRHFGRVGVLQRVLVHFEQLYGNFCRHGFEYLAPELLECSAVLGREVCLKLGRTKVVGTAVGFDDNGALLLKNAQGLKAYAAGEVTLR